MKPKLENQKSPQTISPSLPKLLNIDKISTQIGFICKKND